MNTSVLLSFVALTSASVLASCASAPAPASEPLQSTAQAISVSSADFSLSPNGGVGTAIAVGPSGPWVAGTDSHNSPFQLTGPDGARSWAAVPPNFNGTLTSRIAVSPEGTPWRVDGSNHIQRYLNGSWQNLPGSQGGAVDIGVGPNNQAWVIGTAHIPSSQDYYVYSWSETAHTWNQEANAGGVRIAVGPDGTPWLTNHDQQIWKRQSAGSWTQPQSTARASALGVGPNGTAWVIGTDASAYAWNAATSSFALASSAFAFSEIAVGPDGTPWAITTNNGIVGWSNSWQSLGPSAVLQQGSGASHNVWSGDIEDIDVSDYTAHGKVVVGTTGGGVWQFDTTTPLGTWSPLTDGGFASGPSLMVPSLAKNPANPNEIVVATGIGGGTGSGAAEVGNGIWKGSFSNGWRWTQATCAPQPCSLPTYFRKIRYNPVNTSTIYATTSAVAPGLYLSVDGAATFKQITGTNGETGIGPLSDVATDPDGIHVYLAETSGAVVTLANGVFLGRSIPPGLALTNPQTSKLAVFQGDTSTILLNEIEDSQFNGVWVGRNRRTGAMTWTRTGLPSTAQGMQTQTSGHNSAMAISPISASVFMAAAIAPFITFDGGGTNGSCICTRGSDGSPGCFGSQDWTIINYSNINVVNSTCPHNNNSFHSDVHAIAFADGSTIFMGTDGGMSLSSDGGHTWSTLTNNSGFTVSQVRGVSASGDNVLVSSWDTGNSFSTDHGSTWTGALFGDATDALATQSDWYIVTAQPSSAYKSSDHGVNWSASPILNSPGRGGSKGALVDLPWSDSNGTHHEVYAAGGQLPGQSAFAGVFFLDDGKGSTRTFGSSAFPFAAGSPATVTAFIDNSGGPTNGNHWVVAGAFGTGSNNQDLKMSTELSINAGLGWSEIGDHNNATNRLPISSDVGVNTIRVIKRDGVFSSTSHLYVLATGSSANVGARVFVDSMADVVAAANGNSQPNWIEVTGNLPQNLTYNDLIVDPTSGAIFVGTNVGVFKMSNSCAPAVLADRSVPCWSTVWQPWGSGLGLMPSQGPAIFPGATSAGPPGVTRSGGDPGLDVQALDGQTRSDGRFYVYAGTWNRGVMVRDSRANDL